MYVNNYKQKMYYLLNDENKYIKLNNNLLNSLIILLSNIGLIIIILIDILLINYIALMVIFIGSMDYLKPTKRNFCKTYCRWLQLS